MNKYRIAREFCFQFFSHTQIPVFKTLDTDYMNKDTLREAIALYKETTNTLLNDDLNAFAFTLISQTVENSQKLEDVISENLKNWKVDRLSKVDKTILMMSVNELIYQGANAKIVINVAVELSKKFGTKESFSFVNGILDNISKKYGKM